MAARTTIAVGASIAAIGCSLIVATSDLTGGDALPVDAGTSVEAATPDGAAAVDAGLLDATAPDGADASRDPSLVAAYSFEDPAGGAALDSSGNGKHAALFGGASFTPSGKVGHALALQETQLASVSSLSGASFPRTGTLSLWFRYSSPSNDVEGRGIFDNYDKARSHVFIRRADGATAGQFQIALQPADVVGDYSFVCNFTVVQNTWTHVAVGWDESKSEGTCHAAGVLLKQAAYVKPFVPTAQLFRLGSSFIGDIDEVRLYDRVLTIAELDALVIP